MKPYIAIVVACLILASGAANAAGCLKGAAVGAVAGHVAGRHTIAGAVGGCIIGRHMANEKAKQEKEAAQARKLPQATPK